MTSSRTNATLSNLPTDLLGHIMSFLSIKEWFACLARTCVRFSTLAQREPKVLPTHLLLLDKHKRETVQHLPQGFVLKHLELDGVNNLTVDECARFLPHVQNLMVCHVYVFDIQKILTLTQPQTLRTLRLNYSWLNHFEEWANSRKEVFALTSLELAHCALTYQCIPTIVSYFPHLQKLALGLNHDGLSPLAFHTLVNGLPQLTHFNLHAVNHNERAFQITDEHILGWAHKNRQQLQCVHLTNCCISQHAIHHLSYESPLQELCLQLTQCPASLPLEAKIKKQPLNLRRLRVTSFGAADICLTALLHDWSGLGHALEEIEERLGRQRRNELLFKQPCQHSQVVVCKMLAKHFPRLKRLSMVWMPPPEGQKHLCTLTNLEEVEFLHSMFAFAPQHFTPLLRLPRLKQLAIPTYRKMTRAEAFITAHDNVCISARKTLQREEDLSYQHLSLFYPNSSCWAL